MLRVMVVDDSVLFRKVLGDVLAKQRGVAVVGNASNGQLALDKIPNVKPDVLTLDIEMPVLDGIETLKRLRKEHPSIDVVMVSSQTVDGAKVTLEALSLGAVDFISKPAGGGPEKSAQALTEQIGPILAALEQRRQERGSAPIALPESRPTRESMAVVPASWKPSIVAIAVSTGGPAALQKVIPKLPKALRVPLVMVQHMPALFTKQLAESLDRKSEISVVEAAHGKPLKPGVVYIAPGGKQMKLVGSPVAPLVTITDDPPERHCKPAADYLFRSLARLFQGNVLGVVLTGMGDDGTLGARLLKRHSMIFIAQDEATSAVFGMPRSLIEAGLADFVLPLDEIAERITQLVRGN
jgi:two-component system chemotaxis response regulator CheB